MKKLALSLAVITTVSGLAKKPLDHDSFDSWNNVQISSLSNDGVWAAYAVNPQEGDGTLYFRNTKSGSQTLIPRGYKPQFSADSRWAASGWPGLLVTLRWYRLKRLRIKRLASR